MELVKFPSRGGFSVRSIFTFVFAVILTALLWTTLSSAPTHAAGDATWKGDTIVYDGRQYYPGAVSEGTESHGLPAGTQYYLAVEEVSVRPLVQKAHVIYFTSSTSPPAETTTNYVIYDFSANKTFSSPSAASTVNITPRGEEGTYGSSCSVSGIGWIICPVTVFLAESMDSLFGFIANFVSVPPVQTSDTNTPLYTAWNIMRSVANIAFIIAFLIIIYSQLTSLGISNYGLKKLIPRLIVAAVLVNISFFVCALFVDISNIAGYSLQDILITIREDTFVITGDTWDGSATGAWSQITALLLSGGAATAGIVGLSTATGGSLIAGLYLLIPLLAGLLLTVVIVLLILAARQAIIIILIVIAPLAFVANLLPNTEKWFEKWKDLFTTMLIFFPAFSLVFGGSQLAGGIIIQNASNIIMMIFGMAVQVAPLVITPLLLKLSGGLLGRIAGMVNNPSKGLLDRTKNMSKERAEMHRQNSLANGRKINPLRATARRFDASKRNAKKATELYSNQAETRYMETNKKYEKLVDQEHEAHQNREIVDTGHKLRAQDHMNHRGTTAHLRNVQLEAGKRALERSVQVTKADVSEYSAFDEASMPANLSPALRASIDRLSAERQTLAVENFRATSAESVQKTKLADALIASEELQIRAGGIDKHGKDAALASAVNTVRSDYSKSVEEARQIIKHFNLSSSQRQKLALLKAGESITVTNDDGKEHKFTWQDTYAREAAIEDQIAVGTIPQVEEIVRESGYIRDKDTNEVIGKAQLFDFRTTISAALAKNGLGGKSLYLGGKTIDDVANGRIAGQDDIIALAMESIGKGKISEKDLANIDPLAVERLLQAARRIKLGDIPQLVDDSTREDLLANMKALSRLAGEVMRSDESVNIKTKARPFIEEIARYNDPDYVPPTPNDT